MQYSGKISADAPIAEGSGEYVGLPMVAQLTSVPFVPTVNRSPSPCAPKAPRSSSSACVVEGAVPDVIAMLLPVWEEIWSRVPVGASPENSVADATMSPLIDVRLMVINCPASRGAAPCLEQIAVVT